MDHPDKLSEIDELHAHFRRLLVDGLSRAQLMMHDYFSRQDPLFNAPDDFDEFPLYEGIPEFDDDDQETLIIDEGECG